MPWTETGERHAKWTNAFAQIVGSQLVNIVLAENLNLAGGMIALAERGPDGLPTEAGNLQIKAASIIASTLHDFDNGSSYGVAFGLLMDPAAKLGPSDMRLKVGVDRSSRDVYSALSISDAAIITDSIIGALADPSSRVGEIDRTHGSMDSIIPTRDLWDFVSEKIASEEPPVDIDTQISTNADYFAMPEDLDDDEIKEAQVVIKQIDKAISDKYPDLPEVERAKIALMAFNISENLAQRPEILGYETPISDYAVSAGGALILAIPAVEALLGSAAFASIITLATDTAIKYSQGNIGDFLTLENQFEEYDNIRLEKSRYKNCEAAQKPKFKDNAAAGMPDPDDFESDEDEPGKEKFDPANSKNHDKVSRHNKYGKFYRDSKDSKVWYSKDRAGHGGEHWKKFVEKGDDLVREADVDMAGKRMSTSKGVGKKISMKEFIGIK